MFFAAVLVLRSQCGSCSGCILYLNFESEVAVYSRPSVVNPYLQGRE
jgi:hypothetical protein